MNTEEFIPQGDSRTIDRLCGDWTITQLKKGHRFSTDDMVCAWFAALSKPEATKLLDIGAGVGSVGLMTLWQLSSQARLTMVEAQEVSHMLARETIERNGLGGRVIPRFGDLRDPLMLPKPEYGTFDIVTGSPPYFPVGTALASPHPQRAACRMELRGSVVGYCETGKKALAPNGRFALVHSAVDSRVEPAIDDAGLKVLERHDIVFREGRPPTISVWICDHKEEACHGLERVTKTMVVRQQSGEFTPDYQSLRSHFCP